MIRRLPARPAQAGWTIDRAALEAAVEELGLRLAVSVRLTTGWRRAGKYRSRPEGHVVLLSGRHPAERANRTLWHELAHARQAERDAHVGMLLAEGWDPEAVGFVLKMSARQRYEAGGLEYESNALEVEARELAEAHASTWLLG